jgi:adenylosuccinate synthase
MSEYGKAVSIRFLKDIDAQIATGIKKHACANRSEFLRLAVNHLLISDRIHDVVDEVRTALDSHDQQFAKQSGELLNMLKTVGQGMGVANERSLVRLSNIEAKIDHIEKLRGSVNDELDDNAMQLLIKMTKEFTSLASQVEQLTAITAELVQTLTDNVINQVGD